MKERARWRERSEHMEPLPRSQTRRDDEVKGLVHTYVCPACHAILRENTWFVDEEQYQRLDGQPGVWPALCSGCLRVARGMYQGEVILHSHLLVSTKSAALTLIGNEEERAGSSDPLSRLTAVEDYGDEIKVLTTTTILAERIGQVFRKVYEGHLDIQRLPLQRFSHVRWQRE